MSSLRDIVKKYCYTPNSLRHDLEGELVLKHLRKHGPFAKLLDAGAGGGGYTVEILKESIADYIVAVESDGPNYRVLCQRALEYPEKVETHECFLEETPIENGTMDAVICNQVLEHIEDHHHAAQRLIDYLKPGGLLVASVPRSPVALPQVGHVRDGYTEEEFSSLFSEKGMEVIEFDWFYTEETQKIRSRLKKLRDYNIFPPKFLFSLGELKISAKERSALSPMGLMITCRKPL